MTQLTYLAVHKVYGADAGSFLQAQLAADTAALADGQSGFAAYCSPKGQVIALLLVCRKADDWFIITHARLAGPVASRLRMFVLRAKVTIEPAPGLHVAGLASEEEMPAGVAVFTPAGPDLRYVLTSSGYADNHTATGWRREEIRHGVIWLQSETSERFLPQMLGLDTIGAISFSKGCYPGQEIIARTRYLGKLKRKPVLLELEGSPHIGPAENCVLISAGERIEGVVADSVCMENSPTTLLVIAPLEADQPLNSLEINADSWPARRIERIQA